MPYIWFIHIYYDWKNIFIHLLLVTDLSLYRSASRIHWVILIPLEFFNICLPYLIMIYPLAWSSCMAENKIFQRLTTCNTFPISFIWPLFNFIDTSPWPIIWCVVLSPKKISRPFSNLLYVTKDFLSCDTCRVTLVLRYEVLSFPPSTTMAITNNLLS